MFYEFDMAPTRKDTYNLLTVFNRQVFPDEFIQFKSTEMLTKNIIANISHLDLDAQQKAFLKTEQFKDELFLLLKHNFTTEELKKISNLKITDSYIEVVGKINAIIFEDLINNFNSKFENMATIIVEFHNYISNNLNLSI